MFNFKAVLQQLVQRNASVLHLKVGRPPSEDHHLAATGAGGGTAPGAGAGSGAGAGTGAKAGTGANAGTEGE